MIYRNWVFAAAALCLVGCGQETSADAVSVSATPEAARAQQDAQAIASTAASGAYAPEANHRYITFSYMHQGYSRPWLRWRDWTGTLNWDGDTPENSSVSVTINAESIDSGVDVFDGHLKSDKFFDAATYKEMTFVSTGVARTGANTGLITGDLTIKGVTKPVTLDVVFNKGAYEERGNKNKLGFSAKTSVNRSDFGVDFLVPAVSDKVDIVIETEWVMTAAGNE